MTKQKTRAGFAGLSRLAPLVLFAQWVAGPVYAQEAGPPYPVIYSTDLYYTIQDIDDYFDAATLLKSPELDVKGKS